MNDNISANTLFHFTSKQESLLSILKNGIFIRYSLESFGKIIDTQEEIVLPMACFCDIPLSNVKEHIGKYGKFAIGLSKEWGMKNGLSPVIYTYEKSVTSLILNGLTSDLSNFFNIENTVENKKFISTDPKVKFKESKFNLEDLDRIKIQSEKIKKLSTQLGHFLKYIKPYEGKGYSNGNSFENIRFYNEREWRYVPPREILQKVEVKDSYKKEFYIDIKKRRYMNIRLASHKKLTFDPNDIRFIIVEKDNQIPHMIKELGEIFGDNTTHDKLMLLTSRLISIEQILEDL